MTRTKWTLLAAIGGIALLGIAGVAYAQGRDPAYQAARSAGQIGEQVDGYLGVVGGASPAIRALVEDINIKRRQAYTQKAGQTGATVAEVAFASGCNLIAGTASGEKYQAPDGSWQTRGGGAPLRSAKCV